MLIASMMTIGSGIFCVANSSAAFLSLAFVIGLVLLILGVCEVLVGWRADFAIDERGLSMTKDGVIVALLGLAIFTGQITDESSAQVAFALFLSVEGILSFRPDWLDLMNIETDLVGKYVCEQLRLMDGAPRAGKKLSMDDLTEAGF